MFRSSVLLFAIVLGYSNGISLAAQIKPPSTPITEQKAILTVSISGLRNDLGQVLIQLWNAPDGFPTKGEKGYKLLVVDANKAISGTVTQTFDVTPGIYAVSTLHDENRNNKMDTNALGIPKEGYGASNNVVTHFHPPSFDQAKFLVPASGQKILISMRY